MEEVKLEFPLKNPELIKNLRCGDEVFISGIIITGRDAFHKKISSMKNPPKFLPPNSAIYHCGPIVLRKKRSFKLIAAGPTTSWRMGLYAPLLIKQFGVKAFIGKGGMNDEFCQACKNFTAVYLSFPGGCAQTAMKYICEIRNVYFLEEFGPAEAAYELIVKDMPTVVTIDSIGKNMHKEIEKESLLRFSQITQTK